MFFYDRESHQSDLIYTNTFKTTGFSLANCLGSLNEDYWHHGYKVRRFLTEKFQPEN